MTKIYLIVLRIIKKKKERWTSFRILKSRIFGEEFPLSLSGNEPDYHT